MAYEVTATRRRPKTFDDLVGQEFVASTLRNSIKNGNIAHAYLFSGPRGCGKTSTARILAKVLNCTEGPDKAPCGHCTACQEIARGTSMDVIEIDGASNTSVNDVRQIKDEVLFPPNSCKYKIYIIDEVHMLSTNAFNALLKTIEEPPPYVIFIFATTELHKVPATIKSRCQQFHFRLGSMDQIKDLLAKAAEEAGIQAEDEALYWIARESTGSFRDAYTLFDQVAAFSDGHITYEGIRDKLGLVGAERLNELCELCCDGNTGAALEKIDSLLQAGISIEQLLTNLTDYLRSLLLIQNGITKEALLGQSKERFSQKVLASWDSIRLERAISLFLQLYRDLRYSLNPRYELELAVSRLCWLTSYVSAREVKYAIDNARALLGNGQPVQPLQAPAGNRTIPTAVPAPEKNEDRDIPADFHIVLPVSKPENPQPPVRHDQSGSSGGFSNRPFAESGIIQEQPAETKDIAADPNISVEDLRAKIISDVELKKALLATSLKSSGEWKLNDGVLTVPVTSAYLKTQIDGEIRFLTQLAGQYKDPSLKVKVELEKKEKDEEKENLPKGIELLCRAFNGEVVNIGKVEAGDSTRKEYAGGGDDGDASEQQATADDEMEANQYFYDNEGDQDEY